MEPFLATGFIDRDGKTAILSEDQGNIQTIALWLDDVMQNESEMMSASTGTLVHVK